MNPLDIVPKFGKKVNYENKMSQHELMQEHLQQMKNKVQNTKEQRQ
jgi:hypothetical protein